MNGSHLFYLRPAYRQAWFWLSKCVFFCLISYSTVVLNTRKTVTCYQIKEVALTCVNTYLKTVMLGKYIVLFTCFEQYYRLHSLLFVCSVDE